MRIGDNELKQAIAHLEAGSWHEAHEIVQEDEESPLACWAHGIAHLMEGDAANARYWFRKAGQRFPEQPSTAEEISALKSAAQKLRANT